MSPLRPLHKIIRMRFEHLAIIGVGMIGGSFAASVRRSGLATRITGWDGGRGLEKALLSGAIEAVEHSFEAGLVCDADLIYLAAPIGAIVDFLNNYGSLIKPGAIVTDAGSTKQDICEAARNGLPAGVAFVGGHPMAGSQNSGLDFANPDIFHGAPYALIAADDAAAQDEAFKTVVEIVNAIGARPFVLTAEQHDRAVARVSHVPQLVSTALSAAIMKTRGRDQMLSLAGPGLSDMTRLAESNWSIWEDICRSNSEEIAEALSDVVRELEITRLRVDSGDFRALGEAFKSAGDLAAKIRQSKLNGGF